MLILLPRHLLVETSICSAGSVLGRLKATCQAYLVFAEQRREESRVGAGSEAQRELQRTVAHIRRQRQRRGHTVGRGRLQMQHSNVTLAQ